MSSKHLLCVVFLFLLAPALSFAADDGNDGEQHCGLTNLGVCLPEKIYEFTLGVVNAPLQPFLSLIKKLLTEPVNTGAYAGLWSVIVYVISLFYGLFVMFSGLAFIVWSYNPEKREEAKLWLRNVVLMVFFVQASYFLYGILSEISAGLSAGVIGLIDPNFFLLTVDNIPNVLLEFTFAVPYWAVLLLTVIFLGLQYLIISVGVVFFPVGLFFNFIPPLQDYGKLIINMLMIALFLPFFQSIILLFGSKMLMLPLFANLKILVSIIVFALVVLLFIVLVAFVIIRAVFAAKQSTFGRAYTSLPQGGVVRAVPDKAQTTLDRFD